MDIKENLDYLLACFPQGVEYVTDCQTIYTGIEHWYTGPCWNDVFAVDQEAEEWALAHGLCWIAESEGLAKLVNQ